MNEIAVLYLCAGLFVAIGAELRSRKDHGTGYRWYTWLWVSLLWPILILWMCCNDQDPRV